MGCSPGVHGGVGASRPSQIKGQEIRHARALLEAAMWSESRWTRDVFSEGASGGFCGGESRAPQEADTTKCKLRRTRQM